MIAADPIPRTQYSAIDEDTGLTAPVQHNYAIPSDLGSNKRGGVYQSSAERPAFSPDWVITAPSGYTITEHLLGEPPVNAGKFRILCLGAGASGIDFLHHAITLDAFKGLNVEIVCYEKNKDVGGTWLENRYPGCACDIPSVSYQFPWKPKPDWTSFYSGSKEIWQYMKSIVDEEDLARYIKLNRAVTSAVWDDNTSTWIIRSKAVGAGESDAEVEEAFDFFVNGSGFLNDWKWPSIPGLSDFRGKLCHTASYDEKIDLRGKRVAVIGSGSSGVQTVAAIHKDVEKLYHWVRSPIWVTAGYGSKYAGESGTNLDYTELQKTEFRENESAYLSYRKKIERELNTRFKFILRDSVEAQEALEFSYTEMAKRLSYNEDLIKHIIPTNFNVGCRRPTPGTGYLEALASPKTKTYFQTVHSVTAHGFKPTSLDEEVEVDVIICATGFDTSYRPRFPIVGLNGTKIEDVWRDHALGYISTGVPHVPNYFTYFGPYSPVAQGSLLPVATALSQNVIKIIQKMRKEHIRRLSPKPSVVADFGEHATTFHKRTAWTDPCHSWFKQGRTDANPIVWPGTRLHYLDVLSTPKFEDYEIEYVSGNRWGWLGNGFTSLEFTDGDVTYYLGEESEQDKADRLAESKSG